MTASSADKSTIVRSFAPTLAPPSRDADLPPSATGDVDRAPVPTRDADPSAMPAPSARAPRTHLRAVPRAVPAAVSVVDRLAPELVARGALRLWCRPARARHRDTVAGGDRWTLAFGRGAIVGQAWGIG